MPKRCLWAMNDSLLQEYHDKEWGVQVHNDRKHFEFLILEGAQAGLSWLTILKKRQEYRRAFNSFNPVKVAKFSPVEIKRLLSNPGIVRNRLKVVGAVVNARKFLEIQREYGSFDDYIWRFTGGRIENRFRSLSDVPAKTRESDAMSKDLKKRGFKFVGSTICYSYMQAVGIVNDHTIDCFRHNQV